MVGFTSNFCGKFYERILNQFPNDTPSQILERLLKMWKKHTTQRRFGITCKDNCPCGGSWSDLWLPICESVGVKAHRKEDVTTKTSSKIRSNEVNLTNDDNIVSEEFQVPLRPSRNNLGCFCVSTKNGCVVASVDPNGFLKKKRKENLLGAVITAVAPFPSKKLEVDSADYLANYFNKMKMIDGRMHIWFKVCHDTKINQRNCRNDWSDTGSWKGKDIKEGWAGGAMVATTQYYASESIEVTKLGRRPPTKSMKEILSKNKLANYNKNSIVQELSEEKLKDVLVNAMGDSTEPTKTSVATSQKFASPDDDSPKDKNNIATSAYQIMTGLAGESSELSSRPISILRRRSNDQQKSGTKKAVHFNKILAESSDDTTVKKLPLHLSSRYNYEHERTVEALSTSKTFSTFLKCLKKGPITNDEFEKLTKDISSEVERLTEETNAAESAEEYDANNKKMDYLTLKRAAVKIFQLAGDIIHTARYYGKNPTQIDIMPIEAKNIILTKERGGHENQQYIFCSLFHNNEFKLSTKEVALDWASSKAKLMQVGNSNFLPVLFTELPGPKFKEDIVKLQMMKVTTGGSSIELGSTSLVLSDLGSKLDLNAQKVQTNDLSSSQGTASASMTIKVKKVVATDATLMAIRDEIAKKLKEVIDWIKKFQLKYKEELRKDISLQSTYSRDILDGNISSFGNVTLLHAAIVSCNKQLVQELLDMGANRDTVSEKLGSPKELALELVKIPARTGKENGREYLHGIIKILDVT
mmetsp:Transcript_21886/g.26804  ORF Transcript_21886/g.26804 Transcript_21886/m.26804 type:complete len:755 (-) Transcript_21886:870-3134(-)